VFTEEKLATVVSSEKRAEAFRIGLLMVIVLPTVMVVV
jgi:hypothetical protein